MQTRYLKLEDYIRTGEISPADEKKIAEAAGVLQKGGLVAFPTETVYGLGGDAGRPDVSRRIYAAKGRPSDNPLIVHIADFEGLNGLAAKVSADCRKMMEAFWPGPMTMVVPRTDRIPKETTGGLDTVAVRMPVHKVARELIRLANVPVAAPSANRSGRPSTTTAAHCAEDLDGLVDVILDGGPCDIGVESAIYDSTGEKIILLRPGAVTKEMAAKVLGYVPEEDRAVKGPLAAGEKPKAPGMKYRHYAPKAPIVLVAAGSEKTGDGQGKSADAERGLFEKIAGEIRNAGKAGEKTEAVVSAECARYLTGVFGDELIIRSLGSRKDQQALAHDLFAVLRETDKDDVDRIVAEGFSENDLGQAVMNRLKKAAGWNIITP